MNAGAKRPSYGMAGLGIMWLALTLAGAQANDGNTPGSPDLAMQDPSNLSEAPRSPAPDLALSGVPDGLITGWNEPLYPAPLPDLRPIKDPSSPDAVPLAERAPSDRSLADALKLLLQSPVHGQPLTRAEMAELTQLDRYYASRTYQPLFIDNTGLTKRGQGLVKRLGLAADDGLDVPQNLLSLVKTLTKTEAGLELALARAAVSYARDARGARIEPSRLSKSLTPKLDIPDAEQVLRSLQSNPDNDAALQAFNPQHTGYLALRSKLQEWRDSTASLPDHLANRKGEPAVSYPLDTAEFLINMERWRWLPAEPGQTRIEVNIPEYTLRLYENGQLKHTGRVVVGKPNTQTPLFSSVMDHVVINPSWGVPASILKNEFLPKLAADPDYAQRQGYQVIRNTDERIIGIRQPPGERNALGFIKFMFPNEHAVYLHDTPQRSLFARSERAFSHGCVRVDQPFALANVVLSGMGYDESKLKALIGKGEKTITLQSRLPVHLTYFTLRVDEHGQIQRFADIYGHDQKVRTALLTSTTKMASLPLKHATNADLERLR